MKIAMADETGGKFSRDIKEHWEVLGHEVKFEAGASPALSQWADIYYVDFWTNNIHYLYKLYNGDPDHQRPTDWDNDKKPRFVCRAIDWDVWIGFARDQTMIDWVNDVICIAPHIRQELEKHASFGSKLHLIRPGVNLHRFTPKTRKTDGFQLGMVLGDMWWPKNHMAGLDIFTSLLKQDKNWRLHIRGQHEGGNEFWTRMYESYLESREIKDYVTLYPQVEEMNQWYEQIDFLLHPGMKESFCYAIGEAMAKGIPVACNNFYGAKEIWDEGMLYNTHEEAIALIASEKRHPNPLFYRTYIERHYSLERMLASYDELLGT